VSSARARVDGDRARRRRPAAARGRALIRNSLPREIFFGKPGHGEPLLVATGSARGRQGDHTPCTRTVLGILVV
jgi:hypothetical protein